MDHVDVAARIDFAYETIIVELIRPGHSSGGWRIRGGTALDVLLIFTILAVASGVAFYFLPAIVAGARHARHFGGIFILDLLFGWTVIGWFGTLIWACTDEADHAVGRVPCPYCAEAILPAAKVCPHCRRDLPDSFAAAQIAGAHGVWAPMRRNSPIPAIIVLIIFLVLLVGALYHRHVRFERNLPSFVSTGATELAVEGTPGESHFWRSQPNLSRALFIVSGLGVFDGGNFSRQ